MPLNEWCLLRPLLVALQVLPRASLAHGAAVTCFLPQRTSLSPHPGLYKFSLTYYFAHSNITCFTSLVKHRSTGYPKRWIIFLYLIYCKIYKVFSKQLIIFYFASTTAIVESILKIDNHNRSWIINWKNGRHTFERVGAWTMNTLCAVNLTVMKSEGSCSTWPAKQTKALQIFTSSEM